MPVSPEYYGVGLLEKALDSIYHFRMHLSGDNRAADVALVRTMASLLNKLPDSTLRKIGSRKDASHVERLLESGAFVDASLALLGRNCGYLLTRAPTGAASAVITIDDECDEDGYFAESLVAAILGALCSTLLSMSNERSLATNVIQFGPR